MQANPFKQEQKVQYNCMSCEKLYKILFDLFADTPASRIDSKLNHQQIRLFRSEASVLVLQKKQDKRWFIGSQAIEFFFVLY